MQSMSFVKACRTYFGFLPDQNLSGFMSEVKSLDDKDREYFTKEFEKVGIQINQNAVAA